MATAEAAITTETYSDRIRAALGTLARFGVTEEQVRAKANLSAAEWERFKESPEDMSTIELLGIAEALFVDFAYLITGDRSQMVAFSARSWTGVIRGSYPEIEA